MTPPPPPADLVFAVVIEDTVHAWTRPLRWESVLPDRHARLVRGLGCPSHGCRETAAESLASEGPAALRALAWGRHARDAEVADRCAGLLDRLFACASCGGTGVCPDDGKADHQSYKCPRRCRYDGTCGGCFGTGDTRFETAYEEGEYVRVPAGLFGGRGP